MKTILALLTLLNIVSPRISFGRASNHAFFMEIFHNALFGALFKSIFINRIIIPRN